MDLTTYEGIWRPSKELKVRNSGVPKGSEASQGLRTTSEVCSVLRSNLKILGGEDNPDQEKIKKESS